MLHQAKVRYLDIKDRCCPFCKDTHTSETEDFIFDISDDQAYIA